MLDAALRRAGAHVWLFSSSEAIDHLEALDGVAIAGRIARRSRPIRASPRGRDRPASARARGAPGARRGGRLHTIDATVTDDPRPPPSPDRRLRAADAAAAAARPLLWRWSGPLVAAAGDRLGRRAGAGLARRPARAQHRAGTGARQQDSAGQAAEARLLAAAGAGSERDAAAKVALLEARVAEVAVQRGQLEELIQSLSRSRDENLVVDIEAAIRVALQQTAITGSAEPLVATLKQSDERLARYNQPRLERVRRAIARDLERVKATSVADIASLAIKLDEAVRMVDELPLLSAVGAAPRLAAEDRPARREAPAPAAAASAPEGLGDRDRASSAGPAASSPTTSGRRSARWCG